MNFLIRMKFWVLLGLVVLVAGGLFALLAVPALAANRATFEELDARRETFANYAKAEYVKNEQWIERAQQEKADYMEQLEKVQDYLAERDELLEKRFEDPEDPDAVIPLQSGRWKIVYTEKMEKLLQRLEEHVTRLGSGSPLVMASLSEAWLTDRQMHWEEKLYWLQKAVVDTIVDLNAARQTVPVFHEFRLVDRPERLLSEAHQERFRCIAFQLRVATEFKNVPRLLQALLAHKLGLEVTGLSIARSEQQMRGEAAAPVTGIGLPGAMGPMGGPSVGPEAFGPGAMPEGIYGPPTEALGPEGMGVPFVARPTRAEEPAKRLPSTLVSVTIRGYLPDYLSPGEEEEIEEEREYAPMWGPMMPGVPPVR